eukprot:scaffold26606_cov124-Isochrysis_galbana.AAC.7
MSRWADRLRLSSPASTTPCGAASAASSRLSTMSRSLGCKIPSAVSSSSRHRSISHIFGNVAARAEGRPRHKRRCRRVKVGKRGRAGASQVAEAESATQACVLSALVAEGEGRSAAARVHAAAAHRGDFERRQAHELLVAISEHVEPSGDGEGALLSGHAICAVIARPKPPFDLHGRSLPFQGRCGC